MDPCIAQLVIVCLCFRQSFSRWTSYRQRIRPWNRTNLA